MPAAARSKEGMAVGCRGTHKIIASVPLEADNSASQMALFHFVTNPMTEVLQARAVADAAHLDLSRRRHFDEQLLLLVLLARDSHIHFTHKDLR